MKKKNNYFGGNDNIAGTFDMLGLMGGGLGINPFMHKLFALSDERRIQAKKDELGITSIDNLEGSETLGIPHIYSTIDVKKDHIVCWIYHIHLIEGQGCCNVYSTTGKFLFNTDYFKYKEEGMFLVGKIGDEEKDAERNGLYALYNQDIKVTDYLYKSMMDNFNPQGFCHVSTKDYSVKVVLNKEGKVCYESTSYESIYIYGVICYTGKSYINLLTGEHICNRGYNSTLDTDTDKFVQSESNSIYQINKNTGEYVIHGVPETPKPVPVPMDAKTTSGYTRPVNKGTEPNPKIQGRNEPCSCGSQIKFKNCCGKLG